MKSLISRINLSTILLISYSGYFIYFLTIGNAVNLPLSLILIFLIFLFAFQQYMEHIKKPDPNKALDQKFLDYQKEIEDKLEKLNSKIVNVDISTKMRPISKQKGSW
jgi:hypothetical protein